MRNLRLTYKAPWINIKRIMSRRFIGLKDYSYPSLSNVIGCMVYVMLSISCAASSVESPEQKKVLTGYDQPEQERTAEANDMACSYFYFLWRLMRKRFCAMRKVSS